jgi:regulator of sigma E protease
MIKKIDDWYQLVQVIQNSPDIQLKVKFSRNGHEMMTDLKPRLGEVEGKNRGYIGVSVASHVLPKGYVRKERYGFFDAFIRACEQTYEYSFLTLKVLGKMLFGSISLSNIGGPISIAAGAGMSIQIGFEYYLGFLGLISVSLAVLNLLPVPLLDGGHLLFYLIEFLTGKPLAEKWMLLGQKIGMMLLMGLMFIAFYNDIARTIS